MADPGSDAGDLDAISSVHPSEAAERQRYLDSLSAEFLAAGPTGVIIENLQLFTDGTHRPVEPVDIYGRTPQVFGPSFGYTRPADVPRPSSNGGTSYADALNLLFEEGALEQRPNSLMPPTFIRTAPGPEYFDIGTDNISVNLASGTQFESAASASLSDEYAKNARLELRIALLEREGLEARAHKAAQCAALDVANSEIQASRANADIESAHLLGQLTRLRAAAASSSQLENPHEALQRQSHDALLLRQQIDQLQAAGALQAQQLSQAMTIIRNMRSMPEPTPVNTFMPRIENASVAYSSILGDQGGRPAHFDMRPAPTQPVTTAIAAYGPRLPVTFDDRPSWSSSAETHFAIGPPLPAPLAVATRPSLLPKDSHALDIMESDLIPASFYAGVGQHTEDAISVLIADRPLGRIVFRVGVPPLTSGKRSMEAWVREAISELPLLCPRGASAEIMRWFLQAMRLEITPDAMWSVPGHLAAFDRSYSLHLKGLLSADPEFSRRIEHLEWDCLAVGRTLPARKLISMIGYRIIRDPVSNDGIHIAEWGSLVLAKTALTIEGGLLFLENMQNFVGRCDLFNSQLVTARVIGELSRISDAQLKRDLSAYSALHPLNPQRRWEFFPSILRRILNKRQTASLERADLSQFSVASTAPPHVANVDPGPSKGKGKGKGKDMKGNMAMPVMQVPPPAATANGGAGIQEQNPILNKHGVPLSPAEIVNRTAQQLAAKDVVIAPIGKGKGKGKVPEPKPKPAAAAKAKGTGVPPPGPALTSTSLAAQGGATRVSDKPRSEAGSDRSSRNGRAERPGAGYSCHRCQRPGGTAESHWVWQCPSNPPKGTGTPASSSRDSNKPCQNGPDCRGRASGACPFKHGDLVLIEDPSLLDVPVLEKLYKHIQETVDSRISTIEHSFLDNR